LLQTRFEFQEPYGVTPHFCHKKTLFTATTLSSAMSTTPKPAFNLEDLSNSFGLGHIPQEIAVKVECDDGESGKLSSSTASQHTLLGFNQVGMAFVIKKVVKDELWHNVKFIIDNEELDFNDEPGTICSFMVEKWNVKPEHLKLWWTKVAKKVITASLTEHRNNKIKALQECTLGMVMDVMFYCL
jgi:hypothetical protein